MTTVAVVGLGYVGLPLAVEFGKKYRTIGFDLSQAKVDAYRRHVDPTGEVASADLKAADRLSCTTEPTVAPRGGLRHRRGADAGRRGPSAGLRAAARCQRGRRQEPEARRDRCLRVHGLPRRHRGGLRTDARAPLGAHLEAGLLRRLLAGADQPGRQGAHAHPRSSRSCRATRRRRWSASPSVYGSVVAAGVFQASSIKVAEAAKVIENTQRDLNIALMNELALIFERIGIDTLEVLAGGRHEVELPAVPTRPRRRPLHRRRPVLPHAQGRDARLPAAGDPRRTAHQRRHGQVRRRTDGQAD